MVAGCQQKAQRQRLLSRAKVPRSHGSTIQREGYRTAVKVTLASQEEGHHPWLGQRVCHEHLSLGTHPTPLIVPVSFLIVPARSQVRERAQGHLGHRVEHTVLVGKNGLGVW